MLTELKTMHNHHVIFNKKIENMRKYQTEVSELKNIITEVKNTLEVFNSRQDEAAE